MSGLGNEARRFARGCQHGVLSTLSARIEGFPFGSVAPFVLDHAGCPIVLISDLAEHTRNIQADPRVSLIIQPWSPDMQATGRVTVLGHARALADKEEIGTRYLRYHPQARSYFAMHDFRFHRIEPVRIRYIGGFGKIHWIEPDAYLLPPAALAGQETGIIEHMNADHVASLADYCRHAHGVGPKKVEMIGIDPDGFDLRADDRILRLDFDERVDDATAARRMLVELARQARDAGA